MKRQFDICKMINPKLCEECKGRCCKICGCAYFPEDFNFEFTFENVKSEMDKGFIAIDALLHKNMYDTLDPPIYYLRVRNTNEDSPIGSKLGVCKRLEGDHCHFTFENRPSGGRFLIPFWSGCYSLYTIQEFIDTWTPYQDVLKLLLEHYKK